MSSGKSAWVGSLHWSYSGGYVTVTMYTWKEDGYPSSAASGANFTAKITIGSSSKTFSFQQQEVDTMTVGTLKAYVSGSTVTISGQVEAPYGVSMYGYPLTGSQTVTLYEEEEQTTEPSTMELGAGSVKMGAGLLISFHRDNGYCTHNVYYRAEGGKLTSMVTEAGLSYLWTVPDLSALCGDSDRVTVTLYCDTYEEGTYIGRTTASVTALLPDATRPACNASAAMGGTLVITLNREAENFTHDLSYEMGGESGEITTGAGAVYSWEVPLALAKTIPLLTKGTCTITCVTRNGTLEVGRETVTVALTVPDNDQTKPTGTMVLSPSGSLGERFAGMFIRGRTGVTAEFTGESEYSQVAAFQLVVEGVTVSGNPATSAYLNAHGEVTVTGRVTDARGYTRELTQVISVIAYDKPRVIPYTGESNVVAVRCDLDGTRNPKGQHLLIRAGRKYTALSTGDGQLNYCTLSFRYKTAAAEDYSDFYTLIQGEALERDCAQTVVENAVPELKTGYTLQLRVSDSLGSYSVITVPVAALTIPFHIGQGSGNVAVGKYCDYSRTDAFEIGFTTYFDTGIALREIFADGSWETGTELGSTVAEAEVSTARLYTLFLAVCDGVPVLLVKWGGRLFGSGIQMTLEGSTLTLTEAPAAVTALYAVL